MMPEALADDQISLAAAGGMRPTSLGRHSE